MKPKPLLNLAMKPCERISLGPLRAKAAEVHMVEVSLGARPAASLMPRRHHARRACSVNFAAAKLTR